MVSSSELDPQRELQNARVASSGDLTEGLVHLVALHVELRARVHKLELRVVEYVVRLGSELNVQPVDREVLEERHVPVVDARAPRDYGSGVAVGTLRRPGEGCRIEPVVERA